jgi:Na+/proline symporter
MIILGVILYFLIGYLVVSLLERFSKEKEIENELFILFQVSWPIILFFMIIFIPYELAINKYKEPSKLRKWIRGY